MAQHGVAQQKMEEGSMALRKACIGTAQHSTAQRSKAQQQSMGTCTELLGCTLTRMWTKVGAQGTQTKEAPGAG